ncbi:hypothetical protein IFT73_11105 [Aeromicrobium sp. CFBP 8757]|uniref:DUF5667 domain-containing protein n=1 Tax=Aeromicrobium sp. CFBP 8757 TaxID=2775288 RepID=UPI00177EDEFE|nr:DUF5667 domain-containing protein [Aeromicrobium sp. CFBP 8757]MBD8607404.1 hypothetical protein [Aeromicrobium sp. CFBP 8757]
MIGRRSHDDAQSFDDAFNGRPPKDEHIAELVRFAETLCQAAVVEPGAAFRSSLRAQLMTEAQTVLVPMPSTPRPAVARVDESRPVRRRVAAVTAALVTSAGVVGLVASSASAVPGQMLYPIKRSVESAELLLHRDDASRGSFQLAQASERLAEARTLSAQGGSASDIADTLDDFTTTATAGSSRLFTDYTSHGAQDSVERVNDFAAASSLDLAELSSQLPEGLDDPFAAASAAVTDLAGEAVTLCASCSPADVDALLSLAALSQEAPSPPAAAPDAARDDATPTPRPAATPAPAAPTSARPSSTPAPSPSKRPPVTTTPPPAAPLAPLTDPLLGGLLGDEDQVGLVPGLVNGLLGTPKK